MNINDLIKNDLNTYRSALSKQEQSRFDKVVNLHPKLTLLGASKVTDDHINTLSKSTNVINTLLKYKQAIYNIIYKYSVKQLHGYKIGQTVYMRNKPFVICEFGANCFYPVGYNDPIDDPILLDLVTTKIRSQDTSIIDTLIQDSLLDVVKKDVITSNLQWFFGEYASNRYTLNSWYQRENFWSTKQKQDYIKALLSKQTVFTPALVETTINVRNETGYYYEILDGKQRIEALLSFIGNDFDIDGVYYKDFSAQDEYRFLNIPMVFTRYSGWHNNDIREHHKVELFKQINAYGTPITNEHMKKLDNYNEL